MIAKKIELPEPELHLHDHRQQEHIYAGHNVCHTHIAVVQFMGVCNVFFGCHGWEQTDLWEGTVADEEGLADIKQKATEVFEREVSTEYRESHLEMFRRTNRIYKGRVVLIPCEDG